MANRTNLVSARDLRERLGDPALRVLDVRFDLSDPAAGRRAFDEAHVPGSVHLDLDHDLSLPPAERDPSGVGGRHPLPPLGRLAARLGEAGVDDASDVVVLDDSGGMYAGRLWWLLRYGGFDRVRVLDGGLAAWREAGGPLASAGEDEPPAPAAGPRLEPDPAMVADRDEILRRLGDPDLLLVDARGAERYRGEVEPIDARAGHIPGARNLPFAGNLEGGRFRAPEALRERFRELEGAGDVVMYCGSGVSAAHDLLAAEEAGLPLPRLYVGSWSEWSRTEGAPVAVGEEAGEEAGG